LLLLMLPARVGTGAVTIFTALFALLACFLYVPRLLRWGKTIVIKGQPGEGDAPIIECRERLSAALLTKRFLVSDREGKPLADMRHNRVLSRFSYTGDRQPLQIVEDKDALDDSVAAGCVRKQGNKAPAFFMALARSVPALIRRVRPGQGKIRKSRFQRWRIKTREGNVAATVQCRRPSWAGQGGSCILDIDPQVSYLLDRRLLISLALVISGI